MKMYLNSTLLFATYGGACKSQIFNVVSNVEQFFQIEIVNN
jgi:hypothetical protein